MAQPKFTFQNLLYKRKNGEVTGAMSPVMAGQEMVKQDLVPKMDSLIRISFSDHEVHQKNEGTVSQPEWTGYDTLVIISKHKNMDMITIFIDQGTGLMPVAVHFTNDEVTNSIVTPVYRKSDIKQIADKEFREIFREIMKQDFTPKRSKK